MPMIDDNQFNTLKSTTDSLTPMYDKLTDGNTELTSDDISHFADAYKAWRNTLNSAS